MPYHPKTSSTEVCMKNYSLLPSSRPGVRSLTRLSNSVTDQRTEDRRARFLAGDNFDRRPDKDLFNKMDGQTELCADGCRRSDKRFVQQDECDGQTVVAVEAGKIHERYVSCTIPLLRKCRRLHHQHHHANRSRYRTHSINSNSRLLVK